MKMIKRLQYAILALCVPTLIYAEEPLFRLYELQTDKEVTSSIVNKEIIRKTNANVQDLYNNKQNKRWKVLDYEPSASQLNEKEVTYFLLNGIARMYIKIDGTVYGVQISTNASYGAGDMLKNIEGYNIANSTTALNTKIDNHIVITSTMGAQIMVNKSDIANLDVSTGALDSAKVNRSGDTMTGSLDMSQSKIINVSTFTAKDIYAQGKYTSIVYSTDTLNNNSTLTITDSKLMDNVTDGNYYYLSRLDKGNMTLGCYAPETISPPGYVYPPDNPNRYLKFIYPGFSSNKNTGTILWNRDIYTYPYSSIANIIARNNPAMPGGIYFSTSRNSEYYDTQERVVIDENGHTSILGGALKASNIYQYEGTSVTVHTNLWVSSNVYIDGLNIKNNIDINTTRIDLLIASTGYLQSQISNMDLTPYAQKAATQTFTAPQVIASTLSITNPTGQNTSLSLYNTLDSSHYFLRTGSSVNYWRADGYLASSYLEVAGTAYMKGAVVLYPDTGININSNAYIHWRTAGNDSLQIATDVNSTSYSGFIDFVSKADLGANMHSDKKENPTISLWKTGRQSYMYMYSSNTVAGFDTNATSGFRFNGNITAPYYYGDGSNLTGMAGGGDMVNASTETVTGRKDFYTATITSATATNLTVTGVTSHLNAVSILPTKLLYFDGGENTYIREVTGDNLQFVVGGNGIMQLDNADIYTTNLKPNGDNTYTLGANGVRWTSVWAVNGTIQTSVSDTKEDIKNLSKEKVNAPIRGATFKRKIKIDGKDELTPDILGFIADGLPDEAFVSTYDEKTKTWVKSTENVYTSAVIGILCERVKALEERVSNLEKKNK